MFILVRTCTLGMRRGTRCASIDVRACDLEGEISAGLVEWAAQWQAMVFSFPDACSRAVERGANVPFDAGRSVRDEEVIAAANERNMEMISWVRDFSHCSDTMREKRPERPAHYKKRPMDDALRFTRLRPGVRRCAAASIDANTLRLPRDEDPVLLKVEYPFAASYMNPMFRSVTKRRAVINNLCGKGCAAAAKRGSASSIRDTMAARKTNGTLRGTPRVEFK